MYEKIKLDPTNPEGTLEAYYDPSKKNGDGILGKLIYDFIADEKN